MLAHRLLTSVLNFYTKKIIVGMIMTPQEFAEKLGARTVILCLNLIIVFNITAIIIII